MPKTSHPLARDAQSAIDQAARIAENNKQPLTDSLMLLLALLHLPNSQAQAVLKPLNVKVDNLAARSLAIIKLDAKQAQQNTSGSSLTDELEHVLSASLEEMKSQGQNSIDSGILLLGMLQSSGSKAGQILSQYGVTTDQARQQITVIKEKPASRKPLIALPTALKKSMRQGISPIFISLVLFMLTMAVFLWVGIGNNPRAFLLSFVISGWVVSVALHEFGHAITAFWGGDESVEEKGYLTLNPLKYSNPILSVIIPVFMLLIGGIGFPGGAVYINIHALKKPNYRSLVSAAGPFANLLCVLILALPFSDILFFSFFWYASTAFLAGFAFLAFLQITSIMINLLPIPGLDGFGILEPFLPRDIVEFTSFLRPFGFMILFLLVFVESPISNFFWSSIWSVTELVSPNLAFYANEGLRMFLGR